MSEVAKLYDPLGWLSPVIVKAKMLIQTVWTRKTSWDEELPEDISLNWNYAEHYYYALLEKILKAIQVVPIFA